MENLLPNYDVTKRMNLERSIISAILIDRNAMDIVLKNKIDKVEYFRDLLCQEVFKICLWLKNKNAPIDIVSITSNRYYSENGLENNIDYNGFSYDLVQLSMLVSSSAHLEFWLNVLKQYIFQDFWNEISSDVLSNNWDNRDVGLIGENIIREFEQLEENILIDNGNENKELSFDKKREMVMKGELINVPLPTNDLNDFISGLVPPELSILAARPSMGKTSVALAIAMNASINREFKGLVITLEMLTDQLVNRIITNRTSITQKQIREFKFTDEEFELYKGMFSEIISNPNLIFLDSTVAGDLRGIRKAIEVHRPNYVIIDYLQLIRTDKLIQVREQQISMISRTLKSYCNEFNIPILALSQLSRAVESRNNKRPMLSDLRESGAIEQDADNVWFLYREAYYRKQQGQFVLDEEEGNLEWIIGKGRGTGVTTIKLWIDLKTLEVRGDFIEPNFVNHDLNSTINTKIIPPPPPTS